MRDGEPGGLGLPSEKPGECIVANCQDRQQDTISESLEFIQKGLSVLPVFSVMDGAFWTDAKHERNSHDDEDDEDQDFQDRCKVLEPPEDSIWQTKDDEHEQEKDRYCISLDRSPRIKGNALHTPHAVMDGVLSPVVHNDGKERSLRGNDGGPANPHGKASSKGQGWVNEAVGIVDEVPRSWESNRHLGNNVENCPYTRADHCKAQEKRASAAISQVGPG